MALPTGTWLAASESESSLQPDTVYRVKMWVTGPYTAAVTGALRAAWATKAAAYDWTWLGADHAAPLMSAHGDGSSPWPFLAYFRTPKAGPVVSQAGLDPRAIALVVAAVALLVLALAVTSHQLERLESSTAAAVGSTADKLASTVFSPGTIVLGVVAVALVVFAVRGKA